MGKIYCLEGTSLQVRRFLALFLCDRVRGCQKLPHPFTLRAQCSWAESCCSPLSKWWGDGELGMAAAAPLKSASRAGLGRRNLSLPAPKHHHQANKSQPKAQVLELMLPHIQIRYLWSHHSPLNEPMRVWPLSYWVKTFSHGQMIRKLDAMSDKGQRKKSQQRWKDIFHIFSPCHLPGNW